MFVVGRLFVSYACILGYNVIDCPGKVTSKLMQFLQGVGLLLEEVTVMRTKPSSVMVKGCSDTHPILFYLLKQH
jgi:hypothetical protein